MTRSQATPASSQIITLERIVQDRDEEIERLQNLVKAWEEKAATWLASPEAAKRLDGYREMGAHLAEKDAEIDRLRAELDAVSAAIPGPRYMGPPDGGDVTIAEQVRRMAEEVAALETEIAALREQEPLTENYVQKVPDKCDRIVWRGYYYHLSEPIGTAYIAAFTAAKGAK